MKVRNFPYPFLRGQPLKISQPCGLEILERHSYKKSVVFAEFMKVRRLTGAKKTGAKLEID